MPLFNRAPKVRLTGKQKFALKQQKLANKAAKIANAGKQRVAVGVTKEIGKTVSNVASTVAAQRGVESYSAMKQSNATQAYAEALKTYQDAINAIGSSSSKGESGNESTTEVGGSGSKLGG